MDAKLTRLTEKMKTTSGTSEKSINDFENYLGLSLPKDYVEFMSCSNGAKGPIGENSYLVLWPIEILPQVNKDYAVDEFAQGLHLFGSDGSDIAYAFDIRTQPLAIIEVPFIGMSLKEARFIAYTFSEFLEHLHQI